MGEAVGSSVVGDIGAAVVLVGPGTVAAEGPGTAVAEGPGTVVAKGPGTAAVAPGTAWIGLAGGTALAGDPVDEDPAGIVDGAARVQVAPQETFGSSWAASAL